jgi:hypothetical protein
VEHFPDFLVGKENGIPLAFIVVEHYVVNHGWGGHAINQASWTLLVASLTLPSFSVV